MLYFFRWLFLIGGVLLLVCSSFMLIIHQQTPAERVFVGSRESGQLTYTLTRRDGSDQRILAVPEGAGNATIFTRSPAGRWYAIHAPTVNGSFLYSGQIDSDHLITLANTDSAFYGSYPLFSPNGRWILFTKGQYADRDLYVVPTNGQSPPYPLNTGSVTTETVILWTPDSEWIIYEIPNKDAIYRIHRQGGEPQYLADGELTYLTLAEKWLIIRREGMYYRVQFDGSRLKPLVDLAHPPIRLSILRQSLDAQWLFLEVLDEMGQHLFRVSGDGSQQHELFQTDQPFQVMLVTETAILLKREDMFYQSRFEQPLPVLLSEDDPQYRVLTEMIHPQGEQQVTMPVYQTVLSSATLELSDSTVQWHTLSGMGVGLVLISQLLTLRKLRSKRVS